jgi:hypothetical protein
MGEESALSLAFPQFRPSASAGAGGDGEPGVQEASAASITLPQVRILSPQDGSDVPGREVTLNVALLAPRPLAHCRVTINGRPFGPDQGFALTAAGAKQSTIERGLIMSKDVPLAYGPERQTLAQQLPAVATLVNDPRYSAFQQLELPLALADTDGPLLKITVDVETADGIQSDRQILRLRRPPTERPGALRVLAVGVGRYTNPDVPPLIFAAADARDLAAAMQSQAGDGKLYGSVQVKVLTDAEATLPALQQGLAWFTDNVPEGATLVLLVSGHGVKEGAKQSERYYFAPVGLDPKNISGTGLPWREVLKALQRARQHARAVWLLADCCRAAPDLERRWPPQATNRELGPGEEVRVGNLLICTASKGDQPSYESGELHHGLFTQTWLEALRGELGSKYSDAYVEGGVLTLSRLTTILGDRVLEHANKVGKSQEVEFATVDGSFPANQPVFLKVPASQPTGTR